MAQNSSTINYPQSGIEFLTGQPNGSRLPESSHACPERSRRERQATNLRALRHPIKTNSNPNDQTFMAKYATFRPQCLSFVPQGTNKPNLPDTQMTVTSLLLRTKDHALTTRQKQNKPNQTQFQPKAGPPL